MERALGANRRSISSIVITLIIIALLILSGPVATGLKLTMTADKTSVEKGSTVTFTLIVNLTSPDAFVPIQSASLNITGPENRTWTFNSFTGNVTSGNNFSGELTVTPSGSYSGYGYGYGYAVYGGYGYNFSYGYGYGYGVPSQEVTYTINLDTTQMTIDSNNQYNATAYLYVDGETFKSSTVSFKVVAASSPPSGGGGGGGGGVGGAPPTVVCEGRGVIKEPELMGIITLLGHDFGIKYAFNRLMSPLSSIFSARNVVVMSIDITNRLLQSISRTDIGLSRFEEGDIYSQNADYVLEKYPALDTLIVARGDLELDSIVASPLSNILGIPILLVEPQSIPEPTLNVIKNRQPYLQYKKIYIIGGLEAVSAAVENQLRARAKQVVRLGGATRYETAIEVAKEVLSQNGNRIPIITNGREPVIYGLTLANKYRSPIIYLDRPPVTASTFKSHAKISGSLAVESFDTFQAIGDKNPKYMMSLDIKTRNIKDAWMYIHTIGYDSVAEKWIVKLNDNPLVFKIHSASAVEHERSQLVRFDVGEYLKQGVNTLLIEGSSFNVGDQYFITGVTFVTLYESGERTEYWINEKTSSFGGGGFGTVKEGSIHTIYLEGNKAPFLELNNNLLMTNEIEPTHLRVAPSFWTLLKSDVSQYVQKENLLTGETPHLSIVAVSSDDLTIPPEALEKEADPHQAVVEEYLSKEKFEQTCMVYYEGSIPSE